jgi:hypothetical protein
MKKIKLSDGSVLCWAGRNQSKESWVIPPMNMEDGYQKKQENIKFVDAEGKIEAELPADNELFEMVIGYPHDPETHNYNRAERRRIIRAAKKLEKMKKR